MQRTLYSIVFFLISIFVLFIVYLSIFGIETTKFNNLIINNIEKKDSDIRVSLNKIKIKLDIKKIQIYLSTIEPRIVYQSIKVPIKEINLYTKIISILKSKGEINQAIIALENFKVKDIQKLSIRIKPSNFKNYLLNNLNNGEVERVVVDIKLDKNLNIEEYKVNGSVSKIDVKVVDNRLIQDVSFNFISDKNLTLINSLNAKYQGISISNGSLSLNRNKQINIDGNFNSQLDLDEGSINELFTKIDEEFFKKIKLSIKGSLLHNFSLKIDENFKLIDYNYRSSGRILNSQIVLKENFKTDFIQKPIKKFSIIQSNLSIELNKKKNNILKLDGLYNLGKSENKKFKVSYDLKKKNSSYLVDFDLAENIFLDPINFKSNFRNGSNIKFKMNFIKNNILFDYIKFTENKNLILINDLRLNNKNQFISVSNVKVETFNNNYKNNDFKISFKEKISINGKRYDATNLFKQFSSNGNVNPLKNYTKNIEIKFESLITKSKIPLNNFYLIGRINKGKFEKLSAKSEFSKKKYLDISLKQDENNKKILEVYSDLPQVLLADYNFFEGIKGGQLLYSVVFDDISSASKMKIENFKVVKAPAFAKLLTLADLGGIADLLSGEGMSFDLLEINMKSDINVSTVEEIIAMGPSLSVLMEGYIEKKSGLTSLSGTIVPAKMLNNLISKIPLVGSILVGDKLGDGVFGVSFKMKGVPGKIKTTVNPVKTITPRFITRALEKMKKDN